jgi:hypothetical protein
MLALVDKWVVSLLFCFALQFVCMPVLADKSGLIPLPTREARMLANIYTVFPDGIHDEEQPSIENQSSFDVRIFAIDESSECTYHNMEPACKGFTLYIVVSDDQLGGSSFAFRTPTGFKWTVTWLKEKKVGNKHCAYIGLRERRISAKRVWEFKDKNICVSSSGFVER